MSSLAVSSETRASDPPRRAHFADEGIACDVSVQSLDRERQRATYELVVSNERDRDIACSLCGRDANAHLLVFGMVAVGKHSQHRTTVEVPLVDGNEPELFIRATGEGIDAVTEAEPAAPPVGSIRKRVPRALVWALAGVVSIGVGYLIGSRPEPARITVNAPVASPIAQAPTAARVAREPKRRAKPKHHVQYIGSSLIGSQAGRFTYHGRWQRVTNVHDGRLFGSSSRTSSRGANLAFTFTGRIVSVFGVRGPGGGHGVVFVDRARPIRIDFYSRTKNVRAIVFRSRILKTGTHTVRIVALADVRQRGHRSSYISVSGAAYQ